MYWKSLVVLCLLSLFATSAIAAARQRDDTGSRRERGVIARFLARVFGDELIVPLP